MHSKTHVTAHIDELNFKKPIKVHDIVYISGEVIEYGNSSLKLYLEVKTFNPETQEELLVCTTKMVFVHIGKDGHSAPFKK
jgi:acyl-CoA thioesterase YciA